MSSRGLWLLVAATVPGCSALVARASCSAPVTRGVRSSSTTQRQLSPRMMTTSELSGLVAAFSVTHIGLSAVRERLIDQLGAVAGALGTVGRDLTLPSFWIADTNGFDVWPDEATAGRQIYRAGYTAISASLLFPALAAYPEVRAAAEAAAPSLHLAPTHWALCFLLA
eukprot:6647725-Prymnesium_polylepis.1